MTVTNLVPIALLMAYGVAFASVALGFSLIAFDDHPGQLYRVWHVVMHGWAPWAWNPGWWGGYPELQFYPPGFAYLGALVHVGSWGIVSVAASYQALVWLTYLAPALTVWLVLRRVLGDGWLALPGAFVALTLSAGLASGVEGGVHIGMVAARLGWAALPLVPLTLADWMSGRRGFPWSVVPLVAGIALTHPAHLPGAAVLVFLAAWLAQRSRRAALGHAIAALGLAAGLSAFWTVPLLVHAEHTRALAWGSLSLQMLGHPLVIALVVLTVLGTRGRWRPGSAPPLMSLLTTFPWAMVAIVLLDAFALEPLGLRWLPADRLVDSAALGFVLAAGTMVAWRAASARHGAWPRAALAVAAVAAMILLGIPGDTLTVWPRVSEWPRYETLERGMRLDTLWSTLRSAPAGRVLFVRSGVPLVYDSARWYLHSHITAMTPITAEREILNGTFTHPSPLASLLYRGDAGRGAIRELAERIDGRRLFGRDLEALDIVTFNGYADRLGISVVVALEEDLPRLGGLNDNPLFARAASSPPFLVYERRSGITLPTEIGPGRLRLTAAAPRGTWLPARMAYYPLWHATSEGRVTPTRRGGLGDLEIRVPRAGASIELVYERGVAETAGIALSIASATALAIVWAVARRRDRRRSPGAETCG